MPIRGNPKLYVNPESLPVKLEDSIWSSSSSSLGTAQKIIITKEQRDNKITKMKIGYILVEASEPCSFYLSLGTFSEKNINLQEGFNYLDTINDTDIKSYLVLFKTTAENQVFNLEFNLAGSHAGTRFAIKSCKDFENCRFEKVFKKEDVPKSEETIFQVVDSFE